MPEGWSGIPGIVHPSLGVPSGVWTYRDSAGVDLVRICRFDGGEGRGKTYRPNTKQPDGSWKWAGCPAPRPLYQLDRLAAHPDAPVIVVEGEKAADALQGVMTDHIVTTAMHGAQSPHTADWSPLAGRNVTVWPDADEAGRGYGEAVMGASQGSRSGIGADRARIRIRGTRDHRRAGSRPSESRIRTYGMGCGGRGSGRVG